VDTELPIVHVVHDAEHRNPPRKHPGRKERDTILAIGDGVERPAVHQHPRQDEGVYGESAAHPDHLNAVTPVSSPLAGCPGGDEANPGAPTDQSARYLPGITLGSSGVGMPRVTPVDDGDAPAIQFEQRYVGQGSFLCVGASGAAACLS